MNCKNCDLNYYPCKGESRIEKLEQQLQEEKEAADNWRSDCVEAQNKLDIAIKALEELSKYVAYNGDTFACDVAIKALKEIRVDK